MAAAAEAVLVYLLVVPLLAIVPLVYFDWVARRRVGGGRLPPSPWGLPVVGHLHHLVGALPHHAMRDLAGRHGPLVLLRLGELPVVVASSAEAAREVMKTHDIEFATRPMSRMTRLVFPVGTEGIIFAPYGEEWRELRKICTVELLNARRVQSFRAVREEEVGRLLRAVASAPPGQPVNLSKLLSAYAADSSVRAIIGSRFKERDKFLVNLERGLKLFARHTLLDLYPSSRLAMLLSRMPRRMMQHRQVVTAFTDAIIQEHQENRATGNDDKEDLLDVLLRIQREGDLQFPLSTERIKTTIGDMFAGGSETASTALQWIMAELMRNPRVMQKVQDEVRRALAGLHRVTEDVLDDLTYMHMVIKEALRLHPPVPLLLPRECRNTCQLLGFDVPKVTMVLVNAWAISRDPEYWDEAEEFIPERFEHSNIDFKGTNLRVYAIWCWTKNVSRHRIWSSKCRAHTREPPVPFRLAAARWDGGRGSRHDGGDGG